MRDTLPVNAALPVTAALDMAALIAVDACIAAMSREFDLDALRTALPYHGAARV